MNFVSKLLSIASSRICDEEFELAVVPEKYIEGALSVAPIFEVRNGFYAFVSSLRVFGSGGGHESDIVRHNSDEGWRSEFGTLTEGCFFFGEDVFGGKFCVKNGGFYHFNPHTGEFCFMAHDLNSWASEVLSNYELWTGYPLAYEWQEKHGPLKVGNRLFPKTPFLLGGDYEIDNLWSGDGLDGLGFCAFIAGATIELPDGTEVRFLMPDGQPINGALNRESSSLRTV